MAAKRINSQPAKIFIEDVMLDSLRTLVRKDVNKPARTMIKLCPKEKENSIKAPISTFLLNVVAAIIPAKIGVEQGVAASAKTIPIINAYK